MLEESGAISTSDAKKASSSLVSYQDSVTEMFGDEGDENAVLRDEEEAPTLDNSATLNNSVFMANMGAICKVFNCFFFVIYLTC